MDILEVIKIDLREKYLGERDAIQVTWPTWPREPNRVTKLGKFSPIARVFTYCSSFHPLAEFLHIGRVLTEVHNGISF
jgi:hypothetical protein